MVRLAPPLCIIKWTDLQNNDQSIATTGYLRPIKSTIVNLNWTLLYHMPPVIVVSHLLSDNSVNVNRILASIPIGLWVLYIYKSRVATKLWLCHAYALVVGTRYYGNILYRSYTNWRWKPGADTGQKCCSVRTKPSMRLMTVRELCMWLCLYTWRGDVTESMVTIQSPFCGYDMAYCVELMDEDLSFYSNINWISLV